MRDGLHGVSDAEQALDERACVRFADAADAASVIVFLGPSLPRPEAAKALDAAFRPPACRGDIHRALRERCRTIVLIDGEFHGRPSVWHREILDAIAEGVTVHGSSSMGALRAAELHSFGMVGHGRIFEWYRDGVIEADDEVALTYGPQELGYPPFSEPLVNIRATLAAAVPALISDEERDCLIAHAQSLHYPQRSFSALLDGGPAAGWSAGRRAALADFFRHARIDRKQQDAVEALQSVAAAPNRRGEGAGRAPANALWRRERLVAEGLVPNVEATDAVRIAQTAGIAADALPALRDALSELFFVSAWARAHGICATAEDFARVRHGIAPAADLSPDRIEQLLAARATARAAVRLFSARANAADAAAARRAIVLDWANANGIEHAGLSGDALVDWVIGEGPNRLGYFWPFGVELLDTLRLEGWTAPAHREALR